MVRAVFMGSDSFSLPVFEALLRGGPTLPQPVEVVAAIAQPDRPAGRGRAVREGPIAAAARAAGVTLLQPLRIRDGDAIAAFRHLRADLVVVASYGQILPREVLEEPRYGCLNLHPSLLPRYRGPSPIQAPILAGDSCTGVTLMKVSVKMDAGPIVVQEECPIGPEETAGELEDRLAARSADLLLTRLPDWLHGALREVPQREEEATYTSRLRKGDGAIDWMRSAADLARRVRAYNPWPMAYTVWNDRPVRLLRAHAEAGAGIPGQVKGMVAGALRIGTGDGLLAVTSLQLAGGKVLPAPEAVRGRPALLHAAFDTR